MDKSRNIKQKQKISGLSSIFRRKQNQKKAPGDNCQDALQIPEKILN